MALIVGVLGLLIIVATIFGLLSRFSKHKIAFLRSDNRIFMSFLRHSRSAFATNNNTADLPSNGQLASNHGSSELAASIHTIGERRFYVLPENQIRVIEAPPTYSDALKHPPVSSYTNGGFQSFADTELEVSKRICEYILLG